MYLANREPRNAGFDPKTLTHKLLTGFITFEEREQLINHHYGLAVHLARSYSQRHSFDEYRDEALMALVQAVDTAQGSMHDENLPAWICTVVGNRLRNFRKEQSFWDRSHARQPAVESVTVPDCTGLVGELDAVNQAARDSIDRRIIQLRIEGFTDQEIATFLKRSDYYVNKRRQEIEDRYRQQEAA